ncbi:hypothetical protein JCM16106_13170 [Hydrogenophilus islandicus]
MPRVSGTKNEIHGDLRVTLWRESPESALVAAWRATAQRMADVPICNPALMVEVVGLQRSAVVDDHWVAVVIAPWTVSIVIVPAHDRWPQVAPGDRHLWRFPAGAYEFLAAEMTGVGIYHTCSLFSPPVEFPDQDQARLTAWAVLAALTRPPISLPDGVSEGQR